MKHSAEYLPVHNALRLFAYGTYSDYRGQPMLNLAFRCDHDVASQITEAPLSLTYRLHTF